MDFRLTSHDQGRVLSGRGLETVGGIWSFLDLTPFGRQELWEDSPSGRPQSAPYQWWRRHDEYEAPND